MMENGPKLYCADCEHYYRGTCYRNRDTIHKRPEDARETRENRELCGPEARWFESKTRIKEERAVSDVVLGLVAGLIIGGVGVGVLWAVV